MTDGTLSTPTRRLTRPSVDLAVGAMVGDYQIESKLGSGGMGAVYRAVQPVIGKRVALKVIHAELCEDAAAVTRFVQEARAVNRVGHPNIVDVFGFGTTSDGRAYLAMELLDGVSLAQRMTGGPVLDHAEICDTLIEVSHALEAAHQAGIVHRDLKPDNVFLIAQVRGGARVKLLDFGIAKLTTIAGFGEPVDDTQPGTLVGTPRYMAPEQARGLKIDGAADVYSLGVVAFELFTGRPPFSSTDSVELLAKHITLRPPAPSSLDATLPPGLDELIGGMLEKSPARRPGLAAIREALVELRSARRSVRALAQPVTEILDGVALPQRRRPWLVPAVVAVVAVGVTASALLASRTESERPRAAPAAPAVAAPIPEPTPPAAPVPEPAPPAPAIVSPPAAHGGPERHRQRLTATKPAVKPAPVKPVSSPAPLEPIRPAAVPTPSPAAPNDDALRNPFDRHP